MGFSRQAYRGGLPFRSPGDLPDPGIELESLVLAGGFFTRLPSPASQSRRADTAAHAAAGRDTEQALTRGGISGSEPVAFVEIQS